MKFHINFYRTGYYLCGLKVSEGNGIYSKDNTCYQCSCESKHIFYRKSGKPLESKFLQTILDLNT